MRHSGALSSRFLSEKEPVQTLGMEAVRPPLPLGVFPVVAV